MRQRLLKVKFLSDAPVFPTLPSGMEWQTWEATLAEDAARATVEAYRGSRDESIWRELQDPNLCAEWYRNHQEHFLIAGTGVIRRGTEIVATVVTLADGRMPEVTEVFSIAVSPGARGLSLGDALIQISEWATAQAGVHVIKLQVDAQNPHLVGWYGRLGYVTVDEKWIRAQGVPLSRRLVKAVRTHLLKG